MYVLDWDWEQGMSWLMTTQIDKLKSYVRLLQECINDTTKKTRSGGKRKLILGQLENEGGRQEDAGDQVRQLKYIFLRSNR